MFRGMVDCVLVPLGLALLGVYHAWLLRQVVRRPTTTVIGINAINRRFWVRSMMEDPSKNGVLAVQTLRNNIMASTVLASTVIMLSSLIAVLMTGSASGNGYGHRIRPTGLIYGDQSELGFSIKFFAILLCFLLAFLFNVQSIRYYSHASILINVPNINKKRGLMMMMGSSNLDNDHEYINYKDCVTAEYVAGIVNKGSYFWSLGLRAFYFSFPLFLWIFGPIPMFISCIVLVFMLYFLDLTFDFKWVAAVPEDMAPDVEANVCSTTFN